MQTRRSVLKLATAGVAASPLLSLPSLVRAQEKPIRIGVLYDLSGPFAAAGSLPCAIGAQIAIDLANEHGRACGAARREARGTEEDSLDYHRHRLLGVQGQGPPLRVPGADSFRSIRRSRSIVPRGACQGQARRRSQGPQGRGDLRGRTVRHRRRRGGCRAVQGARHRSDRAQGRLLGEHTGSFLAGDQAQARARRRHPAHRLQPGHHAVPAPVARGRPALQDADRQRRGLQPDRQAARHLRGRYRQFLQRRSGAGPISTISATSIRCRRSCSIPSRWRPQWAT